MAGANFLSFRAPNALLEWLKCKRSGQIGCDAGLWFLA
jgi:hypothetical protein